MKLARGFTLIELLVVISIIAILSTIGLGIFQRAQKSARDARRKVDIDAIAKAMEINKPSAVDPYENIQPAWFGNATFPYDPKATGIRTPVPPTAGCGNSASGDAYAKGCWYCLKASATPGYCTVSDHWADNTTADVSAGWVFCANLEAGPSDTNYFCKGNIQ